MAVAVTLRHERAMLRAGASVVCGVDEVGRGALSGPVTVGMVLVDASVRRPLAGVRDSKLLTPGARMALVPLIREWAFGHAVGHAGAEEVDEVGVVAALRRAGLRALSRLPVRPDVILLDGSHDWLSAPRQASLLDEEEAPAHGRTSDVGATVHGWAADVAAPVPPVVTRVKADLTCASVAAASVLAKTERDAIMVELDRAYPAYGWAENKGYASPGHLAALRDVGPCIEHRRSWNLPEADGSRHVSG